ncbi:GNAT family N-acetyltransferase [Thermaurantiacus tibetensis]|uniref:GNAT family N-acetyltransferase n=1 Tax=Thermaurantiacus tibetensis TaxID=2759035 RepID=UPI00189017DB|nr:N-acetyltransferase [Thermaurantiacus tibetensis]
MTIRHPGADEADAVMATLVAAFATDPVSRWVLPGRAQYLRLFPHVLKHMGGAALSLGTALATEDGRAVALWLPPGHGPDMGALAMAFADAGVMPPDDAPAFFAAMAEAHPGVPHWYLPFIGVDPVAQGRGLGSALMEAALARLDRDRLPAYLENSNPRNRALYERFGFRVVRDIQIGASPLMQPMWRPAR